MSTVQLHGVSMDQLRATIGKLNGTDGVQATLGDIDASNNTVTVTVSYGDSTVNLSLQLIPEIDQPEIPPAEVDAELDELLVSLTELVKAMEEFGSVPDPGQEPAPEGAQTPSRAIADMANTIFDVMKIVQLLLQLAQRQQEMGSLMRAQEHANLQRSLQADYDSIMEQADFTHTMSLVQAGMSAAGAVTSCITTGIGFGMEMNSLKTTGANVNEAKAPVDQIKSTLETDPTAQGGITNEMMQKLGYPADINTVDPQGNPIPEDQQRILNAKTFMKDHMPETQKAVDGAETAYGELQEARKNVEIQQESFQSSVEKVDALSARDACQQKATEAHGEQELAQKAFDKADGELKDANAAVEKAKQEGKSGEELKQLEDTAKAKQEAADKAGIELQKAKDKSAAADKNLADAKDACTKLGLTDQDTLKAAQDDCAKKGADIQAANDGVKAAEDRYTDAVGKIEEAKAADLKAVDDAITQATKKVDDLKAAGKDVGDQEYDEAAKTLEKLQSQKEVMQGIDEFAAMDGGRVDAYKAGLSRKLEAAQKELANQLQLATNDPEFRQGQALVGVGEAVNALCTSLGQFVKARSDYNAAKEEAQRKLNEIERDKANAGIENANELRDKARDDFRAGLSLLEFLRDSSDKIHDVVFG